MSDKIKIYGFYLLVLLLIVFGFWYESNLWSECLDTNSFWYCLRVLSK